MYQIQSNRAQDTFYLTDIFEKLNKVNLQLQGTQTNLIQCKSVIMSFIDKLSLYKQNLSRRDYSVSHTEENIGYHY